jgi:hypothetical protein
MDGEGGISFMVFLPGNKRPAPSSSDDDHLKKMQGVLFINFPYCILRFRTIL